MRRILLSCCLFTLLLSCNNPDKKAEPAQAATVSKHSEDFNRGFRNLLTAYYSLTESFVNWDSVSVNTEASMVAATLDSLKLQDLDPSLQQKAALTRNEVKNDLNTLQLENNITQKRRAFHALSQHVFELLRQVQYDEKKIYLQECPMAFNDEEPGDWLSDADSIRNPYLGLHHPKYGRAMLDCGANKAKVDFTNAK
jgi:hypothetical protein